MAPYPKPPKLLPSYRLVARMAGLVALWLCSLGAPAQAQGERWRSAMVGDERIVVKYRVSERTNENGDEVPLIEYVATTTARISLQRCIALLTDVAKHKDFMGDEVSEKVNAQADTVIYSYYRAPWPLPDNDRVTRMDRADDEAGKTTVFTFSAAPALVEPRKVKRVTHYKAVYTFKDLGEGRVELTTALAMSPPGAVPRWMIRAAFPGVGARILRKILELAGGAG